MPRNHVVTNSPLKQWLVCRKCGASWEHKQRAINTVCPYCGTPKDARNRAAYSKTRLTPEGFTRLNEWVKQHGSKKAVKDRQLLRKRVFFIIAGGPKIKCVRCGCDDSRLLEINHKNGGGRKESESGKYSCRLYLDIVQRRRSTEDLEILCRPCNAIHYLELKFGPLPMKVAWSPLS